MSGPVPSPSMKGMMGWSGTSSLPFGIVIFSPCGGTASLTAVDIVLAPMGRVASENGAEMLSQRAGIAARRRQRNAA